MPMIPPAPCPPPQPLPTLRWWLTARDNMLAVWPGVAYLQRLIHWPTAAQDVLVVNRPDLVRQVLIGDVAHFPKSAMLRRMLRPMLGEGLFVSEPPLWRERRRRLAPLFHNRRLTALIPIIEQSVEALLQDWSSLPDGAVVEVPGMISAFGFQGLNFPALPEPIAEMSRRELSLSSMYVDAAYHGDRKLALQAMLLDPMVDDIDTARDILDDLLTTNREFLPQFA